MNVGAGYPGGTVTHTYPVVVLSPKFRSANLIREVDVRAPFRIVQSESVVLPEEPVPGEETPSVTFVKKNWVWIVVGVVVLIGIVSGLLARKVKRKKR